MVKTVELSRPSNIASRSYVHLSIYPLVCQKYEDDFDKTCQKASQIGGTYLKVIQVSPNKKFKKQKTLHPTI